jgi:hypothetical protein
MRVHALSRPTTDNWFIRFIVQSGLSIQSDFTFNGSVTFLRRHYISKLIPNSVKIRKYRQIQCAKYILKR